jgi:4-amino-4-deoxy-L-arabinose transferase-like glycosyltransferase
MIRSLRRLARFESPTRLDWSVYFGLFTLLHIPAIINFYHREGDSNPYLLFAQSLLKGDLRLPSGMSSYMDMIAYHGAYYLPYPPLPSVILLPFVAIFGVHHVNTVFIVIIMSCLNLYLLYKLLERLKVDQTWVPWLIIAFFFGSGYWYALFTSHHVYAFAQITSCTFQLLFLNELLGKRRWLLIGVFIGCSFLTRQLTIFYMIFPLGYMWYLYKTQGIPIRIKDLLLLGSGCGFFIALYLLYNYARFGNPLDPGYAHILFIGTLKERVDRYGVFSIKYFLFNFYTFFIKGFNIEFQGPALMQIKDMDLWGTSLLSASPFLIASIRAKWAPILKTSAWITIVVILLVLLCYHNNGYFQTNTIRFSLDFLPLLFVLTALGIKDVNPWLLRSLIAYSIFLNLVSFVIHFIYHP